ncbi:hypothetical protein D1Z98_08605 [Riemerella anatipestifer]|uniref:DUF1542 domain-containing protein n=1 Tax=Riemerella anatipestifer TaxID=34085 RepID=UPI00129E70A8|nr:DUF1542 domain-containing protein [Riemerella anatipestifer]MRM95025.1 hypothetical protein [Riemerella anatipestifer]
MDRLILNGTDGFPLYTDTLAEAQKGWSVFNGLTGLAGDLAIIKGCEVIGSQVSDGYVSIGGELYPFKGGSIGNNVIIKEVITKREFKDKSTKPVYAERYATFGSSTPEQTYAWSDFKRVKNLPQMDEEKAAKKELNEKVNEINKLISDTKEALNKIIEETKTSIKNHIDNRSNPHDVKPNQVGILKVGTIFLGDIQGKNTGWRHTGSDYTVELIKKGGTNNTGGDDLYRITFSQDLGTSEYNVLGSFYCLRDWNDDNDLGFAVSSKRTNGFDIAVREYAPQPQNVNFDFLIVKK